MRNHLSFLRHFVEMVVAMVVGMVLLGPLWTLMWPGLPDRPAAAALVMATDMAVGMAVWMRVRGHGGRGIAEMCAAMYVPFLVLLVPYALGLVGGAAVTEEFHPGYRNSIASYVLSLLRPEIIRDLELRRHGLSLIPFRGALDILGDGRTLLLTGEEMHDRAQVACFSNRDYEARPQRCVAVARRQEGAQRERRHEGRADPAVPAQHLAHRLDRRRGVVGVQPRQHGDHRGNGQGGHAVQGAGTGGRMPIRTLGHFHSAY